MTPQGVCGVIDAQKVSQRKQQMAIIATSLELDYHPTPEGLPPGLSFTFTEQNENRTVFFIPCAGGGTADVEVALRDLMSALSRLLVRTNDA